MRNLERWSNHRLIRRSSSVPAADVASAPMLAEPRIVALRFELIVFLLLVATFAAILFQGAIVERRLTIDSVSISRYGRYWYSDLSSGGKSTVTGDPADPMRWSCDLRAGFPFPYCASGFMLDIAYNGTGQDFTKFNRITLDFDYQGPSRKLKLVIKNGDRAHVDPNSGENNKPNILQFPVVPGRNHIELSLADAIVERWWVNYNKNIPNAGKPQFNNVLAMDLQIGDNSQLGHHEFALRKLIVRGDSITPEQWYLILLGSWTGIAALYLGYRMMRMRRTYAERQQLLIAERRLIAEARDAAESASQAKSRFLAHMSHELRTPLNAILGYAQILKASGQTERQIAAASTIQQSGEHLLSLITDILDLSRIEAGKLELSPRPIELRPMVRSVADMIAVRAQEKDVAFHWSMAPDVPRAVVGDDKCLRQVLINLLGNAVKFTDKGEVRLHVTLLSSAGGDVRLRFDVRDTGLGIARDKLRTIFDPFEQAGDSTRRAGGTGLGLSISRRIIELMDGDIQVESTVGVGSRFWFDITLSLADSNALPAATATAAAAEEQESGSAPARQPRPHFEAVPVGESMDRLYELALAGNMRAIKAEAERLIKDEPSVRAFAQELLTLARNFQSQSILELIEKHKDESVAV
jgi:signal transduction histidine kinase